MSVRARRRGSRADVERHLLVPAGVDTFDDAEVEHCDEPVQRYFRAAIAPGTPVARAARIRMHGSIRLVRWLPFRGLRLDEITSLEGHHPCQRAGCTEHDERGDCRPVDAGGWYLTEM